MPFRIKVSVAILLALAGLVLIGPFLVPVPPLEDVVSARELAGEASRFLEVDGIEVHYEQHGQGDQAFVLLHGFGSSVHGWREVLPELGRLGTAVAFDLPGFGLTERPVRGTWRRGANPYGPEGQMQLTLNLMDALGIESAVLVGNSSGGTLAADIAMSHPERVDGLVLVSAAIYRPGGAPGWSRPLLHTPQMNRIGPLLMRSLAGEPGENLLRSAWARPERIDDETLAGHRRSTQVEGWDRALWEVTKASRPGRAADRLEGLDVPTLVVVGEADVVVPPADAEQIAGELPDAELVVLPDCGHTPQEECPARFLQSIRAWMDDAQPGSR